MRLHALVRAKASPARGARGTALAYTKFTRDSFRDLGAFWKRRDSRVNWVRFEAGRDSQREFTLLHRHITVTSSI